MRGVLAELVAAARERTPRPEEIEGLRDQARSMEPARDLRSALTRAGLSVIAEVKRRSPSGGELPSELSIRERARRYAEGGSAALSVLTEPAHFGGTLDDLTSVRSEVDLPVLRKDFLIEPGQVWESRVAGADAVLLITAALPQAGLVRMLGEVDQAGLSALVEVHDEDEAARALEAGAQIVGANNRDLSDLRIDLGVAERLAARLEGVVRVAESGIATVGDAVRMAEIGYHAILVGEALMRASDPGQLVRKLSSVRTPA